MHTSKWVPDAEEALMSPLVSGWAACEDSVPKNGFKVGSITRVEEMLRMFGLYLPVCIVDVGDTEFSAVPINGFDVAWHKVGS